MNYLRQIRCGLATQPCHISKWKRKEPFKEEGLRTLGSLEQQYENFLVRVKKCNAKDFCNAINPPLIQGGTNDQLVIDYLSPPGLHLMQGGINHVYKHLEKCADENEK